MKYPTIPNKPWPPHKPQPPAKQIEHITNLGKETSQEDSSFTIESLTSHIQETYPNVDPNKVRFSFEIEKEYGYYDEVWSHLNIHYFTVEMIDNPQYDKLYKNYKEQLVRFEKEYEKYLVDLKEFKALEKKYKQDLEQWQLEHAKQLIARLEEKKTKKSKKGKKK